MVAGLATVVFVLLSLPAHWSFDSTGESKRAWIVYFTVGVALSFYVVLVFIRALRTLNDHQHEEASDERP